jgi:hypothetical protein
MFLSLFWMERFGWSGIADVGPRCLMPTSDDMKMARELVKAVRDDQCNPKTISSFPIPTDNGDAFRLLLDHLNRAYLAYDRT